MNKTRKAVALKYDVSKYQAPKIVAKGLNQLAERIIQVAKDHDVPIHEDANLVEVLTQLELNTQIPPDLYQAVAEILVFIYKLNQKWSGKYGKDLLHSTGES